MLETLSETQREIVFEKEGRFVVRACPGSGKTYSVAARLANKMSCWPHKYQGIATISFTNAAWQEIERQVATCFGINKRLPYPHFLGTIDSFVNRFVFLPFGHLVMGCKKRPVLVGEPHGPWSSSVFSDNFFTNLTYDIDGNLYPINNRIMPRRWETNRYIGSSKAKFLKMGYANQNDANFFGMKILERYPQVAKSIARRFPAMMIDEAQDTSDIQMRIIDLLIENGLENIMFVGDPDQAIFEWHNAKPQLFNDRYNEWEENSIILNENRRSSQHICNCASSLSSLSEASIAIDEEVRDFEFVPYVRTYSVKAINELIKDFLQVCSDHNIEITQKKVAVIFRSKNLLSAITGTNEVGVRDIPWSQDFPLTKDFVKGKYLISNGEFRKGFKLVQDALVKGLTGSEFCSKADLEQIVEEKGFVNFMQEIYHLIESLPETNCTIGEWVDGAKKVFTDNKIDIELGIKTSKINIIINDLFGLENLEIEEQDYRVGTVHSVKGETFEAVLLILKQKGIGKYYKTLLKENTSISDNEELRIIYVGLTRPRRLLVLAVPNDENKTAWEKRILS
jgi:DNA helicase II / ATP-dependent DNA helicase PcrA